MYSTDGGIIWEHREVAGDQFDWTLRCSISSTQVLLDPNMALLPLLVEEERRGGKMVHKAIFVNSFEMFKMVSLDVSERKRLFNNINLKY